MERALCKQDKETAIAIRAAAKERSHVIPIIYRRKRQPNRFFAHRSITLGAKLLAKIE